MLIIISSGAARDRRADALIDAYHPGLCCCFCLLTRPLADHHQRPVERTHAIHAALEVPVQLLDRGAELLVQERADRPGGRQAADADALGLVGEAAAVSLHAAGE